MELTYRVNKLNVGSKIRIVGWVMLKGLRSGECYQVVALHTSQKAYILRRLTKTGKLDKRAGGVGFYYRQIDLWLDSDNANRIERI